ncbi:MAG: D-2-hydroxyacid dehydrogenase [Victivallales bacterium]|nr:D-2-hydroxyacid dehydrogenase [Victivallales bacterium]
MNIVFLDAYTTNPGDLSWKSINSLGSLTVYDRTEQNKIIERAKKADIIITNKVPLLSETLSMLPKLQYICVAATGVNIVDLEYAGYKNIPVSNVVGYSTASVAQTVFAHILNLLNKIDYQAEEVNKGRWSASKDFTYCDFPIFELSNLTLGIVGFGNIGKTVAKIANSFNMKINVYKPGKIPDLPACINKVDKETLFRKSDIITLHCPLSEDTRNFINSSTITLMKKNAYLINTGRGGLVNEEELADALNSGKIAGAGLDVLSKEPPEKNNPLINAKNCKITPHVAWSSVEARKRLIKGIAKNIKSFINGNPVNVVN